MKHKISFVDVIRETLYGREIYLYETEATKGHFVYYLHDDIVLTNKKKPVLKEVIGTIENFDGEEIPYEGDSMILYVNLNNKIINISINSVSDIILLK